MMVPEALGREIVRNMQLFIVFWLQQCVWDGANDAERDAFVLGLAFVF